MEVKTKNFKNVLLHWYKDNKREYAWRNNSDPWSIYLLEVLSQQTQLDRADKYFKKFIKEFPTPNDMATTSFKKVLEMLSGLGYNSRAKRMFESSKIIAEKSFDDLYPDFQQLPGVGPYTENAILSFAYNEQVITEDINVYNSTMQALGFAPQAYIQQLEFNKNARRRNEAVNSKRTKLLRRRNMAMREGDYEELQNVDALIEKFNAELPQGAEKSRITSETKQRSFRSFGKTTSKMRGGMTYTPFMEEILEEYDKGFQLF